MHRIFIFWIMIQGIIQFQGLMKKYMVASQKNISGILVFIDGFLPFQNMLMLEANNPFCILMDQVL